MGSGSSDGLLLRRGAVLLAGGRSSRMGRPKALVRVGDSAMVARVARALEDACSELVVVLSASPGGETADEDALRGALASGAFAASGGALRFVRDALPEHGPVAGLAAGLAASRAELVLVAPCDLPFLSGALVRGLFARADWAPPPDVVAARRGGFWEPLPAVMRRETMARVYAEQVARGELRPTAAWPALRVSAVDEAALASLDPTGASFEGVNDPAELEAARARLARTSG
ncbi:MAG: molybdenum cofactor guanylyltransferase [Alphaproteobacteria bacterium]